MTTLKVNVSVAGLVAGTPTSLNSTVTVAVPAKRPSKANVIANVEKPFAVVSSVSTGVDVKILFPG